MVICYSLNTAATGSISLMLPFFVLPFISSSFAPVETMSSGIRWFAKKQPMTPIIDSIRSLTLDLPLDNSLMIALTWCIGTILLIYFISLQVYKKKTT